MAEKLHVTKNTKAGDSKDTWSLQRGFDRFYGILPGSGSFYDPAGLAEGQLPAQRSKYVVKDYRDKSGHLQRMLPASSDGFFKADVRLGDFVKKGQLFGTITDLCDHSVSPVSADRDGMVFLVRAVPSVKKEDSLGGILPISKFGEVTIS